MDEIALIRAAQRGDLSAMEALYRRYNSKMYHTALIVLGDPHRAEDAVQETFVRAFRSIRTFDVSRPVAPWLTRIVINRCRSFQQQERRWVPCGDGPHGGHADARLDHAEIHADVWRALLLLPEQPREILMLRYFHDFSLPEIGQILGLPVGTVKSRLHAARQRLKELVLSQPMRGEGKERLTHG